MAVPESNGVSLDTIFAPYRTGDTKAPATNLFIAGVDLNQRYENIIYGTSPPSTGIETNGADLSTIFCSAASTWTASLPSFPNPFTTSPQYGSLTVTLTGGPSGTKTYLWSISSTGAGGAAIDTGQGTETITYTASGTSGEPSIITVTCVVTDSNGASVKATTTMRFNIPVGGG